MNNMKNKKYLITIPLYNDWDSAKILLPLIDSVLNENFINADVLIVDDGSSINRPLDFLDKCKFKKIKRVDILELGRNLGHQRAITIGLSYVHDKLSYSAIIIMDSDGEDAPSDIPKLINVHLKSKEKIIFAKREQRSEGPLFRFFYYLYKKLFYILTGYTINFGNFSLIPYSSLSRLVMIADIWNHYPAGVIKARIPFETIHSNRNPRLKGESKMSLTTLFLHGLSSLSVFGEVLGIRAILATAVIVLLSIASIVIVVITKLATALAIPGWASNIVAIFFVMLIQSLLLTLLFMFIVLQSRNVSSFIPLRDYKYFILKTENIYILNKL